MKHALMALFAFAALLSLAYASQGPQPATSDNPPPLPGGCYDNRDCQTGYTCLNDTCVALPSSCGNGVCSEGEFCYNCPSDCGACPPGDYGSGGHDPSPMQPTYPPASPTAPSGQQPQVGNPDSGNTAPPSNAQPAAPPSSLQPGPNTAPQGGKELAKQDIISQIAKTLDINNFLNTLAAAIGQIPLVLVIAVFGLFVVAGAAGGYILLTRKKEGK